MKPPWRRARAAPAAPSPPLLAGPWPLAQLLVVIVCVAIAFGVRAQTASLRGPLEFRPRPDVLEYVASAQAIAQEGKFYLQLGPLRVRPRYSPGWPLILAAALRLGVPPQRLWILSAAASALVAGSLAWLTMAIVRRKRESLWPACVAGALAGLAWSFGTAPIGTGSVALSDEPATLLAIISVAALSITAISRTNVASLLACFSSGLAFGLLAAVRPPQAALLALPLLLVVYPFVRAQPRLLIVWCLGAGIVATAVVCLLMHSGLNPLTWPAYAAWGAAPGLPSIFRLDYIWNGLPVEGAPRHVNPHLLFALRTLLGITGAPTDHSVGSWWPAAGWLVVSITVVRGLRSISPTARRLAAAVVLWVLTTVAFYSSYYFSAARFYLALLALATCAAAVAVALGLGSSQRQVRLACMAAIAVAMVVQGPPRLPHHREVEPSNPCPWVAAWLRLSDAERRGLPLPFDPVLAQAVGCLTSVQARGVKEWGILSERRQERPDPSALAALLVD